ncbi:MAG TPA: hypothetical protein VEO96_09775 [Thermoplasmata archaeon]|nr:hypothetical protein [Thermoplasmata archaeon]
MYLLDAVLIGIVAYSWTVYPGVVGFIVGLAVSLLGACVFFAWQWFTSKELRASR